MIDQGSKIRIAVKATNHESRSIKLNFISTCACLNVEPSLRTIPGGGEAIFDLTYDSSDDSGITRKAFIVNSNLPGEKPMNYLLNGIVRVVNITHGGAWVRNSPGPAGKIAATTITLLYYYTPGCKSCELFLSEELPRLEYEFGIRIDTQKKNILDTESWEEISSFASSVGIEIKAMPVLRAGNVLLQGEKEIRNELAKIFKLSIAIPTPANPIETMLPAQDSIADIGLEKIKTPIEATGRNIAILSVIAAGLIDGINPCAFTTLIFLLASLTLAGHRRTEILAIGTFFSLGVFLTYLAIGLGFSSILHIASTFSIVSIILRWVLVLALLVLASLSIYDFFLIRAGRSKEMLLQLPVFLKRRIHTSIRTRVRTTALAGSSLVLGFLVSVFEFACTGQIYLPTLAYMVRTQQSLDALALLFLYNFCFITPLLGIFLASFFGVSSKNITTLFQSHMGTLKLSLAIVFLCLALLTITN